MKRCCKPAVLVLDLLENLGFLVNYKTSKLSPVQKISFLGFMIDSLEMKISLPSVNSERSQETTHQISACQLGPT